MTRQKHTKREASHSKAELRDMLAEAVRNTQPQAGAPLPDALKEIAAEVRLPHTQEERS
jgi:Flp pilus assembly protein TadB